MPRAALILVTAAILAGCGLQGAGASTIPTGAPTPPPIVIEDAGLDVPLAPGTYTSRLFEPRLQLELGEGWFRRDDVTARRLDLRRQPDGADGVTILRGIDFLQCGSAEASRNPTHAEIAARLTSMPGLQIEGPTEMEVAGHPAFEMRLSGDGEPVPDDELMANAFDHGCVLSRGEEAYPSEASGWLLLMPDTRRQVIVVGLEDTTMLILGYTDATDDDHYDLVLQLLESVSIGE